MSLKSKNMIFLVGGGHFLLGYYLSFNLVKNFTEIGQLVPKIQTVGRIEQTIRNNRNYCLCLAVS